LSAPSYPRHCEEQRDEAVYSAETVPDCFASLAMTMVTHGGSMVGTLSFAHPTAQKKNRRCFHRRLLQNKRNAYFGYLNSGAAFSASLVVFIDASHLSFFWS
jgi:hypothetical protein